MLKPSRHVVILLVVAGFVFLALGLATDIGLFGWSLAALLSLYLAAVCLRRMIRRSPSSTRESA